MEVCKNFISTWVGWVVQVNWMHKSRVSLNFDYVGWSVRSVIDSERCQEVTQVGAQPSPLDVLFLQHLIGSDIL